ncbi:MAG: UDP-3-O-(3-hydroxymyristoyl)glucosamine N-acyltransferase [Azospirillum sp.]|nr:UDP-3-O-(3-hydroxymyristoyl)glucosamine N-acyltransferase [Azospirillum sp.]
MKLVDIAEALDARVTGDGTIEVLRAVHPADAAGPEDLVIAMDKALLPLLATTPARAAVVLEGVLPPTGNVVACVVVKRAATAMAGLTTLFERPIHAEAGIHPTAVVAPDAVVGTGVSLGAFVFVGSRAVIGPGTIVMSHVTIGAEARVGAACLFHPGVRVGERVEIGDRVILHHNASIGADGFSFITPEPGSVETAKATGQVGASNRLLRRINSIGTVILGDDVEVGANSAIDRGTVTATRVGRNSKIDNLVQIGHNVVVGENCMICGLTGIAGSAVIGNRVVLAGRVGVADHQKIGDDAIVMAGSGVATNVPPKAVYGGYPAVPRDRALEQVVNIGRLKSLYAEVAALKARLKSVEPPPEKG